MTTFWAASARVRRRFGDWSLGHGRREIEFLHPQAESAFLGSSVSHLVIPESGTAGYIYSVQDLTVQKRLEAEFRLQDRMATLRPVGRRYRA